MTCYPQGPPTLLIRSLLPGPAITSTTIRHMCSSHHFCISAQSSCPTLKLCPAAGQLKPRSFRETARQLLRSGRSMPLLCTQGLQALYCLHLLLRTVLKCAGCLNLGFVGVSGYNSTANRRRIWRTQHQTVPGLLRKKRPLRLIRRNKGCMWKKYYNLTQKYQVAFCLKILNIKKQLCTSNLFTIPVKALAVDTKWQLQWQRVWARTLLQPGKIWGGKGIRNKHHSNDGADAPIWHTLYKKRYNHKDGILHSQKNSEDFLHQD